MKPYLFSTSSHPDAIDVNALEISFFTPVIDFSLYDYIILTSKQAVNALSNYNFNDYKNKKALCISSATAQSFKNININAKVLDIGEGYGSTLSNIIASYPKTTKWLYLRAKIVASDFVEVSKRNGFCIDEVILYESKCAPSIKKVIIHNNAQLIFTSPSSVECFLKYHSFKEDYTVVVIGKTTAKALPSHINCIISPEPSIISCLKIINLL